MPRTIEAIQHFLSCPDDGQPLHLAAAQLLCKGCGRGFPLHEENLAEVLPSRPVRLPACASADYYSAYLKLFEQQFHEDNACLAWGAEETATPAWIRKRRRQVLAMEPLVAEGIDRSASVLCDIAAGAGYYTFAYARYFRFVLHCDLSVENLSYARRKARERKLENVFFLRIDYFQPPFRRSLDSVLCLDTLIRGEKYDLLLLKSIATCLKPTGKAFVDFHNWWHNPLRRVGILPENFRSNKSYRRAETEDLLRTADFREATVFSFVQEFDPGSRLDKVCAKMLPSTRIIYRVGGGSIGPSGTMRFARK